MSISAILTAAGESTRMGSPKPLLPWPSGRGGDVPLIQYQVSQLAAAGIDEIIVVLGPGAAEIAPLACGPGARIVHNPDYARGKTTSIRAGLRHIGEDVTTILLLAVDQPRPAALIGRVLDGHRLSGAAITAPRHGERGGHPIAFSASLLPELGGITEEGRGIREVIGRHSGDVHRVQIDDPAAALDLNTPDDYRCGYDLAAAASLSP